MSNNKICVFIDRDGVINAMDKYVNKVNDFEFITNSPKAISILNQYGIKVVVVTNQGGIEYNSPTEEDLIKIHKYMVSQLKKFNAKVDAIYYAKTNNDNDPFRKPNTGMFEKAIKDLKLDGYKYYMIGDSVTDIEAGNKINATTILVKTGFGKEQYKKIKHLIQIPNYTSDNLYSSVKLILKLEFQKK